MATDDILEEDGPGGEGEGANAPPFTVSELSGAVKRALESRFGRVRVRGELGRISRPRSGHIYLDLKDDAAVLGAVIWRGAAAKLGMDPEEGDEVIAEGRLTTYPGQSKYQLVIERMSYAGAGALLAKLERMKAALAAEGLFAPERKRPIPFLPNVVGVVTSPTGAVIRDILHRLAERFPMRVLVWPVAVQGAACAGEVAAAIRGFNALAPGGAAPRPDVLIVARGGGSVEDLWGFNEEVVVRAAAESAIPLISAVGHETDTTLIDFAADRRAPTPTAAAEIAAPVRAEIAATLAALGDRGARAMARAGRERARRLRDLARLIPAPDALLAEPRQRLDRASEAAPRALKALADRRRLALARGAGGRFGPALLSGAIARRRDRMGAAARALGPRLRRRVAEARTGLARVAARLGPEKAARARRRSDERLSALAARLERAGAAPLPAAQARFTATARLLAGLSHRATLARGFALVRGADGAVLKRAANVSPGAGLEIEFADGRVAAAAGGAGPAPAGPAEPAKPRAPRKRAPKEQGSLF
ncbi:exodeoxyribonuclease VII large subunit [Rubrimonas cliftonensis]|uniref:Exodeoxyribonuclease 7 large subunit n=1 Tax=Rubrimonas cliftonensis TaxID=89524 RepID=A0A1H4D4N3_9RHOB|nr:exodeoxyribonuclease VII large subunit [Rubrimonas cliftonensis]SEA67460.1 Exodeoxyribonuclease VII large subunit [Rubrimonas cliftonensis]